MEIGQKNRARRVILRAVSILAAAAWMFVISGFSGQNAQESSSLSYEVSYTVVECYNTVSDAQWTDAQVGIQAAILEHPIRKLAHMTEYAILAFLYLGVLLAFGRKRFLYLLPAAGCFVYAMFDEFHQTFVEGRAGRFVDVLIDTSGAVLAMLGAFGIARLAIFIKKKRKR